jgi:hypothetical protein
MAFASLCMCVRDRRDLFFEVEFAPFSECKLAPTLESQQEHAKDVWKPLEAAGVVQVLKERLQLIFG